MLTLTGRTVVSVGIGAAGARELMEAGMNVVMLTHSPDLQQSYVDQLKQTMDEYYVRSHLMVIGEGWVDNDELIIPKFKEIEDRFGGFDCVVAFTGGPGKVAEVEDITLEELIKDVPYLAASSFNFTKRALPYLKKSKAGRVVYITTTDAQTGSADGALVDAMARGAVLSLTYNMARRLAAYGITVNAISVGPFDKKMMTWNDLPDKPDPYKHLDQVPLGRVGTQEDVAYALHYLLSEEASFITGQVINLNGGIFMG